MLGRCLLWAFVALLLAVSLDWEWCESAHIGEAPQCLGCTAVELESRRWDEILAIGSEIVQQY